jgi:hypothetical protein
MSPFGKLSSAIPGLHFTNHLLSLLFWWPAHNSPSFVIGLYVASLSFVYFLRPYTEVMATSRALSTFETEHGWGQLCEPLTCLDLLKGILDSDLSSCYPLSTACSEVVHIPTERVSNIQVQIRRYSSYECLEKGKRNGQKCASCGICQQWGWVYICMERMERHLNRQFDTFSPSEYTSSTQIRSE